MVMYDNVVPKTVKNFKALAKGTTRTAFDMILVLTRFMKNKVKYQIFTNI